jgi:D-glycero-D-manno-heptose 1,7-bisphosphate phosphatase
MRAVFLDRDGVLNEAVVRDGQPYPPQTAAEVRIVAGAAADLQRLKALGLPLIVVTNQPDVARGTQTAAAVEAIHQRLRGELPIDEFLVCFHDDKDGCACRKPKPGLILEGAARYGAEPARSFLIATAGATSRRDRRRAAARSGSIADTGNARRRARRTPAPVRWAKPSSGL